LERSWGSWVPCAGARSRVSEIGALTPTVKWCCMRNRTPDDGHGFARAGRRGTGEMS
jgi:hypothetical protein